MEISNILDKVLAAEGGYTNNPDDSGGETIWGITVATARHYGYVGKMVQMTREEARDILRKHYVQEPKFDKVFEINQAIGAEIIDTGINMGAIVVVEFLQRSLNVLNDKGRMYHDIVVDGIISSGTLSALNIFLATRGKAGETVLLRCLNALQGTRYIQLAEAAKKIGRAHV